MDTNFATVAIVVLILGLVLAYIVAVPVVAGLATCLCRRIRKTRDVLSEKEFREDMDNNPEWDLGFPSSEDTSVYYSQVTHDGSSDVPSAPSYLLSVPPVLHARDTMYEALL